MTTEFELMDSPLLAGGTTGRRDFVLRSVAPGRFQEKNTLVSLRRFEDDVMDDVGDQMTGIHQPVTFCLF